MLRAGCLDAGKKLSKEPARLALRMAATTNPARLATAPFSQVMIDGAGFTDTPRRIVAELCASPDPISAQALLDGEGRGLWRQAVDRVQQHVPTTGTLPAGDDRPLYWSRLQVIGALQQWRPAFPVTAVQRAGLVTTFDEASRGMRDIAFGGDPTARRVIMSGFDPFSLDGGTKGRAPKAAGNGVRIGNPSGAVALALDGTVRQVDGRSVEIQTYTLPVNYTEFDDGYLEDTVGPLMRPGPQQVDTSITMSQGGGSEFDLEQWNGRYHGTVAGNDGSLPCPVKDNGVPQLAVNRHGCNTRPPARWGNPATFVLRTPAQFTTTSLPVGTMIRANTGAGVTRPPGDTWSNKAVAFGTVWHTNFTEFPDCRKATTVSRNTPVPTTYPPATRPVPPTKNGCARQGGGGDYLSNESAYRNTLLRDHLAPGVRAGHIHTPVMSHFGKKDLYGATDATFEAWRSSIVAQASKLVAVAAGRD